MNTNDLKKQYRDLEMQILRTLSDEVNKSLTESIHICGTCLKVNVFDYTELVILHDRLTFLDHNGGEYSLLSKCTLEDLIDILSKLP